MKLQKISYKLKPFCMALALPLMLVTFNLMPAISHASTINSSTAAKISFTFDDSLQSAYTQAAPTLSKYGLTGTDYAITNCIGMTVVPNSCLANTETPYMTWAQVQALQNAYGWEIGSHTVDHKCLVSSAAQDPSDCQSKYLTSAQVTSELVNSKSALASNGINATDFAPPYGDYNLSALAQIAKYYASMRQFKNDANNVNSAPYSDYYLQNFPVLEKTDTVSTVKSQIDTAIANNQWLILTFHNILPNPSQTPEDYEYSTAELDQIAAYVKAKQSAGLIKSVNINKGLITNSKNMFPNSSFNNGISGGWTTDAASNITWDKNSNGSYPDPTNSVKLTSAIKNAHLFSPQVAVDPNTTYLLKNFLNVQSLATGEVAFYVDEYDVFGNWISGQYKARENSKFVESMNFSYTPSSKNVAKARLQVIVAGSSITAYLDNAQMFPLSVSTPPPVTQTNLVANGTFDSGISSGWQTDDPVNILADANNNGSSLNPINSVKLLSTSKNSHLFSPKIPVSISNSYSLSAYLNLVSLQSGGVAFYIDEYDQNGNWISGQYKSQISSVVKGNVSLSYTPSTSNVKSASLQIIVIGNSVLNAYIDDITWYAL